MSATTCAHTHEQWRHAPCITKYGTRFLAVVLFCFVCVCCTSALAEEAGAPPLMRNPAWERLDALYEKMPLVWGRRYMELKSIAEDVDLYSIRLPPMLTRLRTTVVTAQPQIVAFMLDLVPSKNKVHERSYVIGLLQQSYWNLENSLRDSTIAVDTLNYYCTLLDSIHQALENAQISAQRRAIVEQSTQDFRTLYSLVYTRTHDLRDDVHTLRRRVTNLLMQIEETIDAAQENFSSQWIAYYTVPLFITHGAFSRLYVDFLTMCEYLSYDYMADAKFAFMYNLFLIGGLVIVHLTLRWQLSPTPAGTAYSGFLTALAKIMYGFDVWRRLTLAFCVIVLLNSMLNYLPQFHEFIPYIYIQHMVLAAGLALWLQSAPGAPRIWEQILPIEMGQLLLHGDASPLLLLLGMGCTLLAPLLSLMYRCRTNPSPLRILWMGALMAGLLMTALGRGHMAVPLLMLLLAVSSSLVIFGRIKRHPALRNYPAGRAIFLVLLTFFLGVMTTCFLLACSGLDFLLVYWCTHPASFWGIEVYASDLFLFLFLLLGLFAVSKVVQQSLLDLARRRKVLDASALPVLYTLANGCLWGGLTIFILHFMGVDLSSLAFIGGGLSVGIGIAAKTILSNFFCGLALIFSRAVRSGDLVEVHGTRGLVQSINMRSTVVQTKENSILLIPNEEMLQRRLINWTLNNSYAREDVPISVVPESHVRNVLATIEEAVADCPGVMSAPRAQVFCVGFRENAIDFILQVWVDNVDDRRCILSAVRQNIHHLFTERGIILVSPRLEISISPPLDAKLHAGKASLV